MNNLLTIDEILYDLPLVKITVDNELVIVRDVTEEINRIGAEQVEALIEANEAANRRGPTLLNIKVSKKDSRTKSRNPRTLPKSQINLLDPLMPSTSGLQDERRASRSPVRSPVREDVEVTFEPDSESSRSEDESSRSPSPPISLSQLNLEKQLKISSPAKSSARSPSRRIATRSQSRKRKDMDQFLTEPKQQEKRPKKVTFDRSAYELRSTKK